MVFILSFILSAFGVQDVPYKPKEEFEIKLDYQFRQRAQDNNKVNLQGVPRANPQLPYLILNVKVLKVASGEIRVRMRGNMTNNTLSRKVKEGTVVPIDMGFTDDVKDGITSNEYIITFLSEEKKEISRIVILVKDDGTFLVNGDKRGKF